MPATEAPTGGQSADRALGFNKPPDFGDGDEMSDQIDICDMAGDTIE